MLFSLCWFERLAPYLEIDQADRNVIFGQRHSTPIWGCPDWPKDSGSPSAGRPGYGITWYPMLPASKVSSDFFGKPNPYADIIRAQVTLSPRRILVGESWDWHLYLSPTVPGYYNPVEANCGSWGGTVNDSGASRVWDPTRHRGRANYLFFDLHVQAIPSANQAWLGCYDPSSSNWSP